MSCEFMARTFLYQSWWSLEPVFFNYIDACVSFFITRFFSKAKIASVQRRLLDNIIHPADIKEPCSNNMQTAKMPKRAGSNHLHKQD